MNVNITDYTYLCANFWVETNEKIYECRLKSMPFCCGVHILCDFTKSILLDVAGKTTEFLDSCLEWSLERTRLLYLIHNELQGEAIIKWALSKGFTLDFKVKSNTPSVSGEIYVFHIIGNKK